MLFFGKNKTTLMGLEPATLSNVKGSSTTTGFFFRKALIIFEKFEVKVKKSRHLRLDGYLIVHI
jgi:hypothetical protein